MNPRVVTAALVWTIAWCFIAWYATEPARRTADLFLMVEKSQTRQEFTDHLKELEKVYASSPSQASSDWSRFPKHRNTIAAATATNKGCQPLTEQALVELDEAGRSDVALTLLTGGNLTLENGRWTGTDKLRIPDSWGPFLRKRLDTEPSPDIAMMYCQALEASGMGLPEDEMLKRTWDQSIAQNNRTVPLYFLSNFPDGPGRIMAFMDAGRIEPGVASRVLTMKLLERDPAFLFWLNRFAFDPKNIVVSGGAFPAIFDALPDRRDPLWAVLSATPSGSRLPLLRSLVTRGDWPPVYKRWFRDVWTDEANRVGEPFERAFAAGGVGNLGAWVLEEKDRQFKRELSLIFERIRTKTP